MSLSLNSFYSGIIVSVLFSFGVGFGIYCIYKSRKTHAKLLTYMGFVFIFGVLLYMAKFLDFFSILITGTNLENARVISLLSQFWGAPLILCTIYIYAKLAHPQRLWIFIGIYSIIGIAFVLLLFLDFEASQTFYLPSVPGEDLISYGYNINSPIFIIVVIFGLTGITFGGFGLLIKGLKSKLVVRKKYFFMSAGFLIYSIFAVVDTLDLISPIIDIIVKGALLSSDFFLYFGLREEPKKREKVEAPKKEIKIAESLFRLSKKPEQITEEEVTFHKERKICLVCKTKLSRKMYSCPECDALYCIKCSVSLSNLENACWVCNTPFDVSKPVRLAEKENEEVMIEEKDEKTRK